LPSVKMIITDREDREGAIQRRCVCSLSGMRHLDEPSSADEAVRERLGLAETEVEALVFALALVPADGGGVGEFGEAVVGEAVAEVVAEVAEAAEEDGLPPGGVWGGGCGGAGGFGDGAGVAEGAAVGSARGCSCDCAWRRSRARSEWRSLGRGTSGCIRRPPRIGGPRGSRVFPRHRGGGRC
jgi:hypothetical protein